MKTELTTFRVKQGKESLAEEWMILLAERQTECVETLIRENMVYEGIFKRYKNGRLYLTWFSIQKEGGNAVTNSPHEIDKIHLRYWDECIEKERQPESHQFVVGFVPEEIKIAAKLLYGT